MSGLFGAIKAIILGVLLFALVIALIQLMGYNAIGILLGILLFFINNFFLVQIFFVIVLCMAVWTFFNQSMDEFNDTFKHK